MSRDRRQELGDPRARAKAPADGRHDLGPQGVVPDKGDPAVGTRAARGRLGDVVQQSGEAEALAAGHLVGQWPREDLADRGPVVSEDLAEPPLELDLVSEHVDRVAVDIEMVELALLDPPERFDPVSYTH